MIATVRNMRRCEAAGVRAVMMDRSTGDLSSATPGDYFWHRDDEPFLEADEMEPCILVRRVPEHFAEISEGDL